MSILSMSLYGSSTSNGIGGLATGLDTDTLVNQMSAGTKNKINKAYQSKQKLLYRQEAYREISSKLVAFNDKYFSFATSSKTNILSSNFFTASTVKSSSDYVSVSGNENNIKNFQITDVTSVATAASFTSTAISKQSIESNDITTFTASNSTMTFDFNGVKKTITLDGSYTNADASVNANGLVTELKTKLNATFGDNKIQVSVTTGNKISFSSGSTDVFGITDFSSDISALGFAKATYNRLSTTKEIKSAGLSNSLTSVDIGGGVLGYKISVNGKEFTFNETNTLNDIISKINSDADAGVTVYYSSVTDKITVKSDITGSTSDVLINDVGGNLSASIFGTSNVNATNGTDTTMKYKLNGVEATVTRSSLNFTIDDINIELGENSIGKFTTPATFSVTTNTEDIVKNVKQFVDDYNEILSLINKKTTERPNKGFPPLTPDQEEEMEKDEIDKWTEQAKKGMLYGDSKINTVLRNLRNAVSSKTSVSSLTLSSIGIAPASYDTSGKLKFNEETFKKQLDQNPEEVINLFTKESTETNGISCVAKQIQSILKENVGTFGGTGVLIEEAGLADGLTADKNYLSKRMVDYDKVMTELKVDLANEKQRYYKKFTALEQTMNSLNSQSSWLTSMLGQ